MEDSRLENSGLINPIIINEHNYHDVIQYFSDLPFDIKLYIDKLTHLNNRYGLTFLLKQLNFYFNLKKNYILQIKNEDPGSTTEPTYYTINEPIMRQFNEQERGKIIDGLFFEWNEYSVGNSVKSTDGITETKLEALRDDIYFGYAIAGNEYKLLKKTSKNEIAEKFHELLRKKTYPYKKKTGSSFDKIYISRKDFLTNVDIELNGYLQLIIGGLIINSFNNVLKSESDFIFYNYIYELLRLPNNDDVPILEIKDMIIDILKDSFSDYNEFLKKIFYKYTKYYLQNNTYFEEIQDEILNDAVNQEFNSFDYRTFIFDINWIYNNEILYDTPYDKINKLKPFDYDMEHQWKNNNFMKNLCHMLVEDQQDNVGASGVESIYNIYIILSEFIKSEEYTEDISEINLFLQLILNNLTINSNKINFNKGIYGNCGWQDFHGGHSIGYYYERIKGTNTYTTTIINMGEHLRKVSKNKWYKHTNNEFKIYDEDEKLKTNHDNLPITPYIKGIFQISTRLDQIINDKRYKKQQQEFNLYATKENTFCILDILDDCSNINISNNFYDDIQKYIVNGESLETINELKDDDNALLEIQLSGSCSFKSNFYILYYLYVVKNQKSENREKFNNLYNKIKLFWTEKLLNDHEIILPIYGLDYINLLYPLWHRSKDTSIKNKIRNILNEWNKNNTENNKITFSKFEDIPLFKLGEHIINRFDDRKTPIAINSLTLNLQDNLFEPADIFTTTLKNINDRFLEIRENERLLYIKESNVYGDILLYINDVCSKLYYDWTTPTYHSNQLKANLPKLLNFMNVISGRYPNSDYEIESLQRFISSSQSKIFLVLGYVLACRTLEIPIMNENERYSSFSDMNNIIMEEMKYFSDVEIYRHSDISLFKNILTEYYQYPYLFKIIPNEESEFNNVEINSRFSNIVNEDKYKSFFKDYVENNTGGDMSDHDMLKYSFLCPYISEDEGITREDYSLILEVMNNNNIFNKTNRKFTFIRDDNNGYLMDDNGKVHTSKFSKGKLELIRHKSIKLRELNRAIKIYNENMKIYEENMKIYNEKIKKYDKKMLKYENKLLKYKQQMIKRRTNKESEKPQKPKKPKKPKKPQPILSNIKIKLKELDKSSFYDFFEKIHDYDVNVLLSYFSSFDSIIHTENATLNELKQYSILMRLFSLIFYVDFPILFGSGSHKYRSPKLDVKMNKNSRMTTNIKLLNLLNFAKQNINSEYLLDEKNVPVLYLGPYYIYDYNIDEKIRYNDGIKSKIYYKNKLEVEMIIENLDEAGLVNIKHNIIPGKLHNKYKKLIIVLSSWKFKDSNLFTDISIQNEIMDTSIQITKNTPIKEVLIIERYEAFFDYLHHKQHPLYFFVGRPKLFNVSKKKNTQNNNKIENDTYINTLYFYELLNKHPEKQESIYIINYIREHNSQNIINEVLLNIKLKTLYNLQHGRDLIQTNGKLINTNSYLQIIKNKTALNLYGRVINDKFHFYKIIDRNIYEHYVNKINISWFDDQWLFWQNIDNENKIYGEPMSTNIAKLNDYCIKLNKIDHTVHKYPNVDKLKRCECVNIRGKLKNTKRQIFFDDSDGESTHDSYEQIDGLKTFIKKLYECSNEILLWKIDQCNGEPTEIKYQIEIPNLDIRFNVYNKPFKILWGDFQILFDYDLNSVNYNIVCPNILKIKNIYNGDVKLLILRPHSTIFDNEIVYNNTISYFNTSKTQEFNFSSFIIHNNIKKIYTVDIHYSKQMIIYKSIDELKLLYFSLYYYKDIWALSNIYYQCKNNNLSMKFYSNIPMPDFWASNLLSNHYYFKLKYKHFPKWCINQLNNLKFNVFNIHNKNKLYIDKCKQLCLKDQTKITKSIVNDELQKIKTDIDKIFINIGDPFVYQLLYNQKYLVNYLMKYLRYNNLMKILKLFDGNYDLKNIYSEIVNTYFAYFISEKYDENYFIDKCYSIEDNITDIPCDINIIQNKISEYDVYNMNRFNISHSNNHYLIFEFLLGYHRRPAQVSLISNILNEITSSTPCKIHHMIMGAGKTSVINPLVNLSFLLNGAKNIINVMPSTLVLQSKQLLNTHVSSIWGINVNILNYTRKYDYENITTDKKLNNGINIFSDSSFKTMVANNIDMEYTYKTWLNINSLLGNSPIIMDEIDIMYNPITSELNHPIKNQPIDNEFVVKIINSWFILLLSFLNNPELFSEHFTIDNNPNTHMSLRLNEVEKDMLSSESKLKDFLQKYLNGTLLNELNNKQLFTFSLSPNDKQLSQVLKYFTLIICNKNNSTFGRTNKQHLKSSYLAIPFERQRPKIKSEFNDMILTLGYTVFSWLTSKIKKYEIYKYILLKERSRETLSIEDGEILYHLINYANSPLFKFPTFNEIEQLHVDKIESDINLKIKIIHDLLINYVVPTYLKSYNNRINVSFIEVMSKYVGKSKSGFTGTPYIELIYEPTLSFSKTGKSIEQIKLNQQEIKDIDRAIGCLDVSERSKYYQIDEIIIDDILRRFIDGDYDCIIDVGAWFIGHTSENLAKRYLELYKEYYTEKSQPDKYKQINIVFLDNLSKKKIYKGSTGEISIYNDIEDNIKVIFDQAHITGIDIKLYSKKYNASGLVTISANTNKRDLSQGIYRLRKINKGQRIDYLVNVKEVNTYESLIKLINYNHSKNEDDKKKIKKEQELKLWSRVYVKTDKLNNYNPWILSNNDTYTHIYNKVADAITYDYQDKFNIEYFYNNAIKIQERELRESQMKKEQEKQEEQKKEKERKEQITKQIIKQYGEVEVKVEDEITDKDIEDRCKKFLYKNVKFINNKIEAVVNDCNVSSDKVILYVTWKLDGVKTNKITKFIKRVINPKIKLKLIAITNRKIKDINVENISNLTFEIDSDLLELSPNQDGGSYTLVPLQLGGTIEQVNKILNLKLNHIDKVEYTLLPKPESLELNNLGKKTILEIYQDSHKFTYFTNNTNITRPTEITVEQQMEQQTEVMVQSEIETEVFSQSLKQTNTNIKYETTDLLSIKNIDANVRLHNYFSSTRKKSILFDKYSILFGPQFLNYIQIKKSEKKSYQVFSALVNDDCILILNYYEAINPIFQDSNMKLVIFEPLTYGRVEPWIKTLLLLILNKQVSNIDYIIELLVHCAKNIELSKKIIEYFNFIFLDSDNTYLIASSILPFIIFTLKIIIDNKPLISDGGLLNYIDSYKVLMSNQTAPIKIIDLNTQQIVELSKTLNFRQSKKITDTLNKFLEMLK